MSRYLVTLKPLEPYFFGNHRRLQYPKKNNMKEEHNRLQSTPGNEVKVEYYIESEDTPSQTTLLGVLRFLILKKAGKLTSKGNKPSAKDTKDLIGARGFQLLSKSQLEKNNYDEVTYGKLKSVGSLFLVDEQDNYYVPCPLNHKKNDIQNGEKVKLLSYTPFEMEKLDCVDGMLLPTDYKAKDGLCEAYVCLNDNATILEKSDIFQEDEHVGVLTGKTSSDSEKTVHKAFFKRKYKILSSQKGIMEGAKEFKFAFFIEVEEMVLPEREIITLGQQNCPFQFELIEESKLNDGKKNIDFSALCKYYEEEYAVYYAMSPIIFLKTPKNLLYHISKNKFFQCLQETEDKKGHKRSELFQIVDAGSVFYVQKDKEKEFEQTYRCKAYEQIGLNNMIKLGGNK